ncbi:MAG: ATP-grasp domain-containing protein [Frankiaceae bacterium]
MTVADRPLLLVVGKGSRVYREYLLRAVAGDWRVWLLCDSPPEWEARYLAGHVVVDTADAGAMIGPARALRPDGVVTWDDTRVVQAATVAEALGLPGSPPEAALACRDKHLTRTALAAAGVPQAASVLVGSLAEAREAAEAIGYPVVVKPRALNASAGVVLVESADQLAGRFRLARGAAMPGVRITEVAPGGVLVEEYLDGPEISVDAAWQAGRMTVTLVARKWTGFPPCFEEVGHLVDGADPLLTDPAVAAVVAAAHEAVGFHTGWTHTELRLTPAGPRVVEINARIGGDRIPDVGRLALGVDAGRVAATIACGGSPSLRPTHQRVAAVRFLYPAEDGIVREVRVDRDRLPAGVDSVDVIAVPGQELRLPPAGHVTSRYALVTAVADSQERCRAALDAAESAVHLETLRPRPARQPARRPAAR